MKEGKGLGVKWVAKFREGYPLFTHAAQGMVMRLRGMEVSQTSGSPGTAASRWTQDDRRVP